jgi:Trk K+ transport system NAD-binding subunit
MGDRFSTANLVLGSPIRNLLAVLAFMSFVVVAATLGYRAAGWSWTDATYMVTLTIYTVGYGEVRPIDTPYLHAVTMATMVLGCTGTILLTGILVQVFTAVQLNQLLGKNRMKNQIDHLEGHVIICGYGRIGVMLAKDLAAAGRGVIVVERDAAKRADAESAGLLTVAGDATEEAVLQMAGIDRARTLATVLPDDSANVFITLTARSLHDSIEIIARGEAPTTERKLLHAGANRVVLPTHIGAERIAEMILFPETADFVRQNDTIRDLKRGMGEFGLEIEVVKVVADSALTDMSVIDAERAAGGAFFIVQIDKADGSTMLHPGPDVMVEADDTVVLVVRAGRVAAGTKFNTPRGPVRVGRGMR